MAARTRPRVQATAAALLVAGLLAAPGSAGALPAYTKRDWSRLTRWALESQTVAQFTDAGWTVERPVDVHVRGVLFAVEVVLRPPGVLAARGLDEARVSVLFPQEAEEAMAAARSQAGFDAAWSRFLADRRVRAFEAQGSMRITAYGQAGGFRFWARSEVGAERRADYLTAEVTPSGTSVWVSARSWERRIRYVLYLPRWLQLGLGMVLLGVAIGALRLRGRSGRGRA